MSTICFEGKICPKQKTWVEVNPKNKVLAGGIV